MSLLYLEIKYAKMVGQSLDRWKIKDLQRFHGSGRCPVCGDSAKSKTLCRFHIREHGTSVFVSCFNCGYSTNLTGFLKTYHPNLYSEMMFERFREKSTDNAPVITTPKVEVTEDTFKLTKRALETPFTLDLPYVSDLPENDPARVYMDSRHLPKYPFMYASEFYKFSSQFNPELSTGKKDEPRIVIPFFDRSGSVFAYQGRSLSKNAPQKYITIIVNPKIPKIFGIGTCDFKSALKIVEGPLDSLFLKNCLASVNASLVATAKKLSGICKKSDITLVYDNEPRNLQITKLYTEAIKEGYKVVIWPTSPDTKEDINDLVLRGKNPEKIISDNSFSGLLAQLQFQNWKRC